MHALTLLLVALLLVVPAGDSQEKQAAPGQAPHLWLASAAERDGKVVIQIARAWPKASKAKENPAADVMVWDNLRKVTLGETVQAYAVDGKRVEAKTVLKALAKPKGVAVFVRIYNFDPPNPPPFYLALLREGTIVLVVEGSDVYELVP